MLTCSFCGNKIDSFVLREREININGSKLIKRYFICNHCGKEYLVEISAGNLKREWSKLINSRYELSQLEYYNLSKTTEAKDIELEIKESESKIADIVKKGEMLEGFINI